ncbi:polyprenol monophosphomannose synthase [bacterium]|nr:polyprenol monophosphomannose synthase [bacterium]
MTQTNKSTITLSVIIPTLNEEKNISKIISEITYFLEEIKYEIIIVDDHSNDRTVEIIKSFLGNYPVKIITRKERDLSTAVVTGINNTRGEFIAVIDADLSHPAALLPKMLDLLKKNGNDLIVASRKVEGGSVEQWPLKRKAISYIATLLARPITSIKDPMSGYFMFEKSKIKNSLNPIGYKILLEIITKCNFRNIVEIPYTFKNREVGKSKLNIRQYINYLRHISRLYAFKLTKK